MSKFVTPVEGSGIYIFSSPSLQSFRKFQSFHGDVLKVLEKENEFYKVTNSSGLLEGWIPAWMTTEISMIPPEIDIKLSWPTDFKFITQGFGLNPQWYAKYNLPGHEGLDIRAPMNTNIYACADGKVYGINTQSDNHAYGIHVRLQHDKGYKTVYAHLSSVSVKLGDLVKRGQVIGFADSTGNSSGSHLHLTLKKDGATARGETKFPNDIIDPTPYFDL